MAQTLATAILEATPDAIVTFDTDSIIGHINPAAEQLFGYAPDELIGRKVQTLMSPSRAARHASELKRYLEAGESRLLDGRRRFEAVRRDGSRFPVLLGVSEFWPNGARSFVGVIHDLTRQTELRHRAAACAHGLRTAREENARVNEILEGTDAATWDWDLRTDEVVYSRRWSEFLGRASGTPEQSERLDGAAWRALVHPEDLPAVEHRLQQHQTGKLDYYDVAFRMAHAAGGWVWLNARGRVLERDAAGRPIRMSGTHLDITKRKRAENALAHSEARYRSLVESVREVVFQTDIEGRWAFLNVAWEDITGFAVEESLGQHALGRVHPADHPSVAADLDLLAKGDRDNFRRELRFQSKDNTWRWIEAHAQATRDNGVFRGATGTLRDITQRRAAEEQTQHLVYYDSLTQLPNRVLALDRLNELLLGIERRDERVAVLFIDLDDFKKINDSLGHEIGDQLLPEAGRRLFGIVRKQDTVARLGGDEFLVLLGGLGKDEDTQHALRGLLGCFHQSFSIGGRELMLTASIGIAIAPDDGAASRDLLRNADMAMYRAKSEGCNTYRYFNQAMTDDMERRFRIEERLRGALGRGELHVLFQPVIDLTSGGVTGAEALLRWHNEDLGEIAPEEFIPIAEQTGLIDSIGDYVARQALTHTARWVEQCRGRFRVSINVSPQQFRDRRLPTRIHRLLKHTGVPPEALEIEVTEGLLLTGREPATEALGALRDFGVGIAMDDFGTGYASLSYLRQYPFDTLKIDRSFVRESTHTDHDRELVITSLRLASGLGLRAIAEGVETESQVALLRDQGCRLAQGYRFGRPVAAGELDNMIRASAHPITGSERSGRLA